MSENGHAKFALGLMLATPNALARVPPEDVAKAISRHARGDWGELEEEDRLSNERALAHGGRLFSSYRSEGGVKFWIITEVDRSATTVLLPEDY